MKKISAALLAVAAVMLLCMAAYRLNTPEKQVDRFLEDNKAELTQLVESGADLPTELSGKPLASWTTGDHPMYEITVTTLSGAYYGCYYSPDDVPLPFQNADLELVDDVRGGWSWRAEDDNYGYTEQLESCWYYFEAHF